MTLSELLGPQQACAQLSVSSKNALCCEVAKRAALALGVPAAEIEVALLRREELGSTGLGDGIAIPHARLAEINKPVGFLYTLKHAIDFDAIDGRPVGLVFVLLLPMAHHSEHLNALALVARRLREPEIAARLKSTSKSEELLKSFTGEHD